MGLDVLTAALHSVEEELGYDEGEIILTAPNGDTLSCELWESKLEDMLVSARIVSIGPKQDEPNSSLNEPHA